ncbi:hypothetical protein QAD02_013531 [Eretmocerus hayati]|uniref:Uncharacterized protein n=1 Tax=Eretmocerus hayati TaxID=131215 RepID=A0ACC2P343_9HYME|nr:hypothetical protein QAD02_013531 [Eretmocerus hayati]
MEIESKNEEEGEQWVALINYSDKKFGDKSLQIVSCEDIKNFDHRKFEDDMKNLELAKSTRKKLDPLEEEKMKFYYVAWINPHGEKIYKSAEVIAVRGSTAELEELKAEKRPRKNPKRESLVIDVIENRDGEIEANVHTQRREDVDGNSIDDGKGAEESSSSDGGVKKTLRIIKQDIESFFLERIMKHIDMLQKLKTQKNAMVTKVISCKPETV